MFTRFDFLVCDGCKCLSRCFVFAPTRKNEAHPANAFDCPQDINAAGKTPPAVAGGFHKMAAFQPVLMAKGRGVAAEMAAVDFKTEEVKPIAQAEHRNEVAVRQKGILAAG